MKYIYFDASAGLSGDMILGALLDLGVAPSLFKDKMAGLKLPVEIQIQETKRASLRGLKVNVHIKRKRPLERKWSDIEAIIEKSPFPDSLKKNALTIFKNLFQAEARVHGRKFPETHLHEAGADDALIDILGTCFLAEALDIGEFYSSPLNLGEGWVKTAHGVLPVPPPAVSELLKNIPVYSAHAKGELVTPTGAAIVSTLVKKFIPFPELSYEKIGYGAGSRDFPGFPNILRAFYGEKTHFKPEKKVYLIETTIDDSNPQILASFIDTALELGALDAYLAPIVMKKNRLASKLTLLAEIDKIDTLITAIFRETTSIGIRYFPAERRVLEREIKKIKVLGEDIRIKVSYLEGREVNFQPEFADCLKIARKKKLPLKKIIQLALKEFMEKK
jgi:uncharacterized protein (TIGR00299 family) protein